MVKISDKLNFETGESLKKVINKLETVITRSEGKIPYTTKNGIYDDHTEDLGWWTNGFFGGMIWQVYKETGDERYKEMSVSYRKKLESCLLHDGMLDHDNGFRFLPTAVKEYELTGNKDAYNTAILAASNLMGRFNIKGNFIRAWNDWGNDDHRGWAIIDCMMNLPLLYWASKVTKDPRFMFVARAHADTAMMHFIRPDGSVNHIVEFDPFTGEFVKSHGGQGLGEGSCWTRGASWGIYGFLQSYTWTKDTRYLDASIKIADHYIAHIPECGLIPVDFSQDKSCDFEDDCSAAIAACGLIGIAKALDDVNKAIDPILLNGFGGPGDQKSTNNVGGLDSAKSANITCVESEKYMSAAIKLLGALISNRLDLSENTDNLLTHCSASYHEKNHNYPIVYADYYFVEALRMLV